MSLDTVRVGNDDAADQLILLHGWGDDPRDILRIVTRLDYEGRFSVCAPAGPVEIDTGRAWFGHDARGADTADLLASVAALDELIVELGDREGSLVIAGFSQGGAMAMAYSVLTSPERRPDAIVSMCGHLPELEAAGGDLTRVAGCPMLLQAGSHDEVVAPEYIEMSAETLTAAGAVVTFETHEMDHTTSAASALSAGRFLEGVLPPIEY